MILSGSQRTQQQLQRQLGQANAEIRRMRGRGSPRGGGRDRSSGRGSFKSVSTDALGSPNGVPHSPRRGGRGRGITGPHRGRISTVRSRTDTALPRHTPPMNRSGLDTYPREKESLLETNTPPASPPRGHSSAHLPRTMPSYRSSPLLTSSGSWIKAAPKSSQQ